MIDTILDLTADVIDVRDITARIEELELEISDACEAKDVEAIEAYQPELDALNAIMEDLKGGGGDEQWRGDWYPLTLIADCHFTNYAQELVCDCYDLKGVPSFVHIDWEATAREVRMDYSQTTIDGFTYYYR
jgi:hypothetical protein